MPCPQASLDRLKRCSEDRAALTAAISQRCAEDQAALQVGAAAARLCMAAPGFTEASRGDFHVPAQEAHAKRTAAEAQLQRLQAVRAQNAQRLERLEAARAERKTEAEQWVSAAAGTLASARQHVG